MGSIPTPATKFKKRIMTIMNNVKITFRQEEVDAAVKMIQQFNPAAAQYGWSDASIRQSINRTMDYFLTNHELVTTGTMGFTIALADEYMDDEGYMVRSLDILFCCSTFASSNGMDTYTYSYRTAEG